MPAHARAVDRAIALAIERAGVGRTVAPGWLRARVLAVLEAQAARTKTSLEEAARRLEADDGAAEELITALRVGETRFYRDAALWEAVASHFLPTLPPAVELRALSAGCSTGEEAYTLAMLLAGARRRFRVLGVDRSAAALAGAQRAIYAKGSERHLPADWPTRYCEPHPEGFRVRPQIASRVQFEQLDLVQRIPRGPFHVIVFKNVLLYLVAPAGEAVAARLAAELSDTGLLFVATSEVPRLRKAGLEPVRVGSRLTAFRRAGAPPTG